MKNRNIRLLWKRIKALVFPPRCGGCRALLKRSRADERDGALCGKCRAAWENDKKEVCNYCKSEVSLCRCVPDLLAKAGCGIYRKLTYYSNSQDSAVKNRIVYLCKKKRLSRVYGFLAEEAKDAIAELREGKDPENTVIAYVPRRYAARDENGTDQALCLAQALSAEYGIPRVRAVLRNRKKGKKEQKHLSVPERIRNARDAFLFNPKCDLRGKHVILVDDIVTSGASMAACAKLLYRAGAVSVSAFSVCSDDTLREPDPVNAPRKRRDFLSAY